MKLYTFYQLFRIYDANTLKTYHKVKIGQFTIDEGGIIERGIYFYRIDLFDYQDAEFMVDIENDIWIIKKIYYRHVVKKIWQKPYIQSDIKIIPDY
jgi:hypothetical protein